jgi:hypothetical protein
MKRLWLALFATLLCGSVHALNFSQIGGSSGGGSGDITAVTVTAPATGGGTSGSVDIGVDDIDVNDLALDGSISDADNEWFVLQTSSNTGRFRGVLGSTTFYFEQVRESPRFVHNATNNAFEVSAATNPYYGMMKFAHSVSSETNCGYFPMPSVRDYNLDVDFRLDEFRVLVGTGTDSSAQRYVIAVASDTGVSWLNATYTNSITVDMESALGTASGTERALAGVQTLTSWNTVIASGVPWAVRVCRDGDDATNDASSHDSYFSMITIRAGNTIP